MRKNLKYGDIEVLTEKVHNIRLKEDQILKEVSQPVVVIRKSDLYIYHFDQPRCRDRPLIKRTCCYTQSLL